MNFSRRVFGGLVVVGTALLVGLLASEAIAQSSSRGDAQLPTYEEGSSSARPLAYRYYDRGAARPRSRSTLSPSLRGRAPRYGFSPSGGFGMYGRRYAPPSERLARSRVQAGPAEEVIAPPAVIEGDEGDVFLDPQALETGYCDSCGPCGYGGPWYYPWFSLENFTAYAGVQGFKGPPNLGGDSSFGFHEGINWGAPLWMAPSSGIGMQVGLELTQSNFSGSSLTTEDRDQLFFTAGLFRRVDWGLQGGLVIDYLRDEWYVTVDLLQVRGEISWVFPCYDEWGFWFNASTHSDTARGTLVFDNTGTVPITPVSQSVDVRAESTDIYAFFYRRRFGDCGGGEARVFAGFTGNKDGILGGDIRAPLSDSWALQASFIYLIPEESTVAGPLSAVPNGGNVGESWNVGISFVWYPRCNSRPGCNSYHRPLFHVANNNWMLTDGSVTVVP